jgi:hypothetical protein
MKDYIQLQAKREVGVQILFALQAFSNITEKGEGNALMTFSSIHSFLTHAANISKLLWSGNPPSGKKNLKTILGSDLADVLGIGPFPLLKDKGFRDDLDHYDERLVAWIESVYPTDPAAPRTVVTDLAIGTKVVGPNTLYMRHYDPATKIYTFGGRELDLGKLKEEVIKLQGVIGGPTVKGLE